MELILVSLGIITKNAIPQTSVRLLRINMTNEIVTACCKGQQSDQRIKLDISSL